VRGEAEGGGSKVPPKVWQYGTSRSESGKREMEGSQKTKKYECGGRSQGHDVSNADRTHRATQERVQCQRAGPPG